MVLNNDYCVISKTDSNLHYAQTIQNGLLPKDRHFKKMVKDYITGMEWCINYYLDETF